MSNGGQTLKPGFRQKGQPTKKEVVDQYQSQLVNLGNASVRQFTYLINELNKLKQELALISEQVKLTDFRSLATMKLLEDKNLVTSDEHIVKAEEIQISNFEEASLLDDAKRNLMPVLGRGAQNGDSLTVSVEAFDSTGAKLEKLSMMRMKVNVGEGALLELEPHLAGLVAGETKEVVVKLGKAHGEFADQDVKFAIKALDLKVAPPVMEKVSETPNEQEQAATTEAE